MAQILFKLSDELKAVYEAEARLSGKSLSSWLRMCADAMVGDQPLPDKQAERVAGVEVVADPVVSIGAAVKIETPVVGGGEIVQIPVAKNGDEYTGESWMAPGGRKTYEVIRGGERRCTFVPPSKGGAK